MFLTTGIQLYLEHIYNRSPRTKEIYREHLERLAAALKDPPIEEIVDEDLDRFMSNLRN